MGSPVSWLVYEFLLETIDQSTKCTMNNESLNPQPETPGEPAAVLEGIPPTQSKKTNPRGRKAPRFKKSDAALEAATQGTNADRLPTTLKELNETKGGFVAARYLAGESNDAIAKELRLAFKLSESQAAKITRRITGRVRLYKRLFEIIENHR